MGYLYFLSMLVKDLLSEKIHAKKIHVGSAYITHLQVAVSCAVTVKTFGVVDSQLELITVAVSVVRH